MPKKEDNGPAIEKRAKIKKTKQSMMVIVLIAALLVGTSVVLMIHFYKYIKFYGKVIGLKDTSITEYEKTIVNIGLCSAPKGSHYSLDDIKSCNPNTNSAAVGSLRYEVATTMAENRDLESVAREETADICYDSTGKKYDYQALADLISNDDQQAHLLGLLKICSSLRVIPDALPAGKNVEALLASLNKIFTISGWEPESLSPSDSTAETEIEGVEVVPVAVAMERVNAEKIIEVLKNIEKSIRTFDITSASIEWQGESLTLQAQANAFYAKDAGIVETEKTEYATKQARKKASS